MFLLHRADLSDKLCSSDKLSGVMLVKPKFVWRSLSPSLLPRPVALRPCPTRPRAAPSDQYRNHGAIFGEEAEGGSESEGERKETCVCVEKSDPVTSKGFFETCFIKWLLGIRGSPTRLRKRGIRRGKSDSPWRKACELAEWVNKFV